MATVYSTLVRELRKLRERVSHTNDLDKIRAWSERIGELRKQIAATPQAKVYAERARMKRRTGEYHYPKPSQFSPEKRREAQDLRNRRKAAREAYRDGMRRLRAMRERVASQRRELQAVKLAFYELAKRGGPAQ